MANLKTDYKDDILDSTQNLRRKFRMITNDDGTFSFEDVTDYLQYGDNFGAFDLNAITNAIMDECLKRTDTVDNLESTATKLPLSANMGRELNEDLEKFKNKFQNGTVTCSYVNSTTLYGQIYHNLGDQYNCIATPSYVGDNPLEDFGNLTVVTVRHNNLVEFFVKGDGFTNDSGIYVDFLLIKL